MNGCRPPAFPLPCRFRFRALRGRQGAPRAGCLEARSLWRGTPLQQTHNAIKLQAIKKAVLPEQNPVEEREGDIVGGASPGVAGGRDDVQNLVHRKAHQFVLHLHQQDVVSPRLRFRQAQARAQANRRHRLGTMVQQAYHRAGRQRNPGNLGPANDGRHLSDVRAA